MLSGTCTQVIDGETIEVDYSARVRLRDVHAPGTNEEGHEEARLNLEALLLDQTVYYVATGRSGMTTVADVWMDLFNVNEYVRGLETAHQGM